MGVGEWKWGNGGIRMKMGNRDRASRWQNGNREMEMEEWGCENRDVGMRMGEWGWGNKDGGMRDGDGGIRTGEWG